MAGRPRRPGVACVVNGRGTFHICCNGARSTATTAALPVNLTYLEETNVKGAAAVTHGVRIAAAFLENDALTAFQRPVVQLARICNIRATTTGATRTRRTATARTIASASTGSGRDVRSTLDALECLF